MENRIIAKRIGVCIRELEASTTDTQNPYETCKQLSACVKELINRNDLLPIRKCLRSLVTIYCQSTDNKVRTAIENVFIFSLSPSILLCTRKEKLMSMLPASFRDILIEQMTATGI